MRVGCATGLCRDERGKLLDKHALQLLVGVCPEWEQLILDDVTEHAQTIGAVVGPEPDDAPKHRHPHTVTHRPSLRSICAHCRPT